MVKMIRAADRAAWLVERGKRIGGSDAAALVGMNPYTDNVELWRIKTGRTVPFDISGSPFVQYGSQAEEYLRKLFALDFPLYDVRYAENNMWLNDQYPFAHASLDGWMTDEQGRKGVLEIKTANVANASSRVKWDGKIPDNYYCQVLWYMGVVEADFAVVKAQLKYSNRFIATRHYFIEREEVKNDIQYLLEKGSEFWEYLKNDTEPPLILPNV